MLETTEQTRKKDLDRLMISSLLSWSDLARVVRTPAEPSDWIKRRGNEVVLLKVMAGVNHFGILKHLVSAYPIAMEARL